MINGVNPELREKVSGLAAASALSVALGLSVEEAQAEFHRQLTELGQGDSLSPEDIAFLRGTVERCIPDHAEGRAAGYAEGTSPN
ncbi:hypothetical protein U9R90_16825 [Streptomyces sp. E11-3]|uniref:hypothetical protein n=1 Tax=Streptomyces sp. E11-3 TaxID=3110112 RepID=UPI003980D48A